MSNGMVLHCGARQVSLEELEKIPTPPATASWFPVPHAHVLKKCVDQLEAASFQVRSMRLALTRSDNRFFGVLNLATPLASGVGLAVGIRNSNDKSLPIGFCAGNRVFVCDNLSFHSQVVIARKHTRFGDERFTEALSRAVQSLNEFKEAESARIRKYELTDLSDTQAESLMLRAYEKGIISHRLLPRVIEQWRQPTFEEFQPRTLWSLSNAFTTALGERQATNPQQFASLTITLSGLLGEAAGLPPKEVQADMSA